MRWRTTAPIAVLLLGGSLLGQVPAGAGTAPQGSSSAVDLSFRGYANNVRVVPPLVGNWQLGKARIRGSAILGATVDGTVTAQSDPKFSRYSPASMRADVIGYKVTYGAHDSFTKVVLTVQIVSATNGGERCEPGVRGKIKLLDSRGRLSNGETEDYIIMGNWTDDRCPGFVQGWTNADGGERTSPQYGGPPNGGQWAIVRAE